MSSFPSSLPEPAVLPLRGGAALRWGVLAPGAIAKTFTSAMHDHTDQRVVAVASRSVERAEAFATLHGIERFYRSYEQLVSDPDVDVVYIASPHSEHRAHALLAIAAGKHVLVEKPIAVTAAEARDIVDAARSAGVFAMEAMWTRYQPKSVLVHQLLDDGVLGEPRIVTADFGVQFPVDLEGRIYNPALAGGGLLDIGVYAVWFAQSVLGSPDRITASGSLVQTGVDGQSVAILDYDSGAQAIVSNNILVQTPSGAAISGTLASVEVDSPFFAPGGFVLRDAGSEATLRFDDRGPAGGSGMAWQAAGVAQHIADGMTESPWHPLDLSISMLETIDSIREQVGYRI